MTRAVLPRSSVVLPYNREHARPAPLSDTATPARPRRAGWDIDMYRDVREIASSALVASVKRLIDSRLNRGHGTARGLSIGMAESEVI